MTNKVKNNIIIKKPSLNHKNRHWHNWLVYDLNDQFLSKYSHLYQGVLYDLGCGESPYQDFLLQFAQQYIGVDWAGSNHVTKETVLANLNEPLLLDSAVADCVISLSVLEHLYQPQGMLNEAYRLLKPNAAMILQVPWQWQLHEQPHDYFRYTPYALKQMFVKAGFTEVTIECQGGFFTMLFLKINYFSLKFIRGPKFLKNIIKLCLAPFWYLGQKIAPYLDRLDRDWSKETIGFFVTAIKK
ncbi:MAG: SAM-dependent methyltransferase [Robiginitomaculum sp.]|nr:MAG: SAM-dependent methyltransferase [Robiginitomaculum sp.]